MTYYNRNDVPEGTDVNKTNEPITISITIGIFR